MRVRLEAIDGLGKNPGGGSLTDTAGPAEEIRVGSTRDKNRTILGWVEGDGKVLDSTFRPIGWVEAGGRVLDQKRSILVSRRRGFSCSCEPVWLQ